nr:voltage-dependent N-type calcium channel subunit alpha-1B-like [Pan paniscus]
MHWRLWVSLPGRAYPSQVSSQVLILAVEAAREPVHPRRTRQSDPIAASRGVSGFHSGFFQPSQPPLSSWHDTWDGAGTQALSAPSLPSWATISGLGPSDCETRMGDVWACCLACSTTHFHACIPADPGASPRPTLSPLPTPVLCPQPVTDASPMKRSISTLAQRPRGTHLCSTTPDRPPTSQASHHHHHRCHRHRDRKQRSLEKGPSLPADMDGAPSSAAGPGLPPGEGPTGCRRERECRQERGRSQERRQPSSSSSEKQRFYSCDRFGGRETPKPKPSLSSHPTSPTAGQEPGPHPQGSGSMNGSPLLSTSGASTPGRGGWRQLPQTPLTPRPSITYKTANSSPIHFAGAQTSLPAFSPGRLSRGLSEHNALLQRDPLSQPLAPGSRIGSDPYLGQRLDSEASVHALPEDTLTFEEAVATNSGRSSRTSYVSSLTSQSHLLRRMPNGYHCTLGLSSGGRARHSYHHPDQDHWC